MIGLLVLGLLAAVWFVARPATNTTPPGPGSGSGAGMLHEMVRLRCEEFRAIVDREGSWPRLSIALVLGVIARESGGDGMVRDGSAGEVGIMQVTEAAYLDYYRATNDADIPTFDDARSHEHNVRVGSWYLSNAIAEMGSEREGLRAYNAGVFGARNNPNLSADYADWVLSAARAFGPVIA